jgi:hypothetical protein
MREKETLKKIPDSTPDEVAQALGRIEEATLEEEFERKERGLTLEPKGVPMQRGQEAEYFRAKEAEKGKSVPDFIKEWQKENKDYILQNEDVSEEGIINETDIKFPVEFVDYLIGNAKGFLREKGLELFGEIATIKIKNVSDKLGIIIVAVRDKAGATTFLDFHSVPPFELKRSNSSLVGVNTF